ncbi:MAG: hypothetical protein WD100_05505 [Tistlia sp.]
MRKLTILLPLMLAAAFALAGCRATVPVKNVDGAVYGPITASPGTQLTLDDYERAIIRAGSERNWIFERAGPGHLVGTNNVRGKHTAVVDVTFDTESFSIDYKDSSNLKWDSSKRTIHPNYNAWVDLLKADIQAEIQRMRSG